MSPTTRRVLQAVLYEVGAIAFVAPVLAFAFAEPMSSTLALSVLMSTVALVWNYVFNFFFVYAIGFTWAFDRVFGLPESARAREEIPGAVDHRAS